MHSIDLVTADNEHYYYLPACHFKAERLAIEKTAQRLPQH